MYMLKISVNDKKAEDSYCLRGAVCLDGHNEETIEILNQIIWENVEALFVYDSVEDEFTWYATQEIGDYLQSVGSE